jgi:hypothetical protein
MMTNREKKLKEMYGELFLKVRSIINDVDPMNLFPGPPENEYDPETAEILASLSKVESKDELALTINQIFVRWFGLKNSEPRPKYFELAKRIWVIKDEYPA